MADGTVEQTQQPAPLLPPSGALGAGHIGVEQGVDILMQRLLGSKVEPDAVQDGAEPVDPEKKPDAAPQAETDLIEFEGPDGQPIQLTLQDAIAAYTERNDLTQKVQQLNQRQALMPQEVEQALLVTAQARHQLLAEVDQLQATYKPQPPSRELLDKTSQNYDPDLFAAQLQDYERGMQWLQQVDAQKQQQIQSLQREQATLQQATIARGRQELQQLWPEVQSDPAIKQGLAELLVHVGLDPATALSNVTDPRAYLVLKYAMQGLKAEAQAKGQLRAVKSTPRLIRGAGRTNPQVDVNQMTALRKSGHVNDAIPLVMKYLQGK